MAPIATPRPISGCRVASVITNRGKRQQLLAGRWLRRFGPATTSDLQWWMGWTVARTKQALTDCRAVETAVDDGVGWLAQDDLGPVIAEPWVAVLPSLDPTTMGWKSRAWYLPAAASEAFDRNGNAGPTIWVDGRVVGAWAQDRQGEIRTHYFERVAASRRREVQARVAELKSLVARLVSPCASQEPFRPGCSAEQSPSWVGSYSGRHGAVLAGRIGHGDARRVFGRAACPDPDTSASYQFGLGQDLTDTVRAQQHWQQASIPDAAGPDRAGHSAGR